MELNVNDFEHALSNDTAWDHMLSHYKEPDGYGSSYETKRNAMTFDLLNFMKLKIEDLKSKNESLNDKLKTPSHSDAAARAPSLAYTGPHLE